MHIAGISPYGTGINIIYHMYIYIYICPGLYALIEEFILLDVNLFFPHDNLGIQMENG